jgi:hypothetical protein
LCGVLPLAFKNVYVGGAIPMMVLHQLILTCYPPRSHHWQHNVKKQNIYTINWNPFGNGHWEPNKPKKALGGSLDWVMTFIHHGWEVISQHGCHFTLGGSNKVCISKSVKVSFFMTT